MAPAVAHIAAEAILACENHDFAMGCKLLVLRRFLIIFKRIGVLEPHSSLFYENITFGDFFKSYIASGALSPKQRQRLHAF